MSRRMRGADTTHTHITHTHHTHARLLCLSVCLCLCLCLCLSLIATTFPSCNVLALAPLSSSLFLSTASPFVLADKQAKLMARVTSALESGASDHFGRGKLMLVGQGHAGKTTTLRSLLAKPFVKDQLSTVGAATSDMAVTVDTQDVQSWQVRA